GDGAIAEAPTSNIFLVNAEGLATPHEDKVLHGITRASVIELADALGIACRSRDLSVADLQGASEVFLTSTSVGLWPVVQIDGRPVASGVTGPVTSRLKDALAEVTLGNDPNFEHWLHYV
ncbi:MAG: aminotransferase class IV, partial [Gammaproteobacteria bacterium]|nr:aminotransferase class IV [Gammaproteobacteria bacterium]